MNVLTKLVVLLLASTASAQQPSPTSPPAQQTPSAAPAQQKVQSHKAEFFTNVAANSIFIYGTAVNPCAQVPPGITLLPLGSGFVLSINKKGSPKVGPSSGWNF